MEAQPEPGEEASFIREALSGFTELTNIFFWIIIQTSFLWRHKMGFLDEIGQGWNNFKVEMEKMDIPSDKRKPAVLAFLATLILGGLFAPLAWLAGAASLYYAGEAFIKLRKFRNSAADPQGLFGFGVSNDCYVLAGIAGAFFVGCGILETVFVPAVAAAVSLYAILRFTATIRGQDRRRRYEPW